MVSENLIKDCPVKLKNCNDSKVIFGPELAGHQGKKVRQKPQRVEVEYVAIPRDIYSLHRFVTLTADIMFVNGVAFLITLSRQIRLVTIEHVPSRTALQLSNSLTKVKQLYGRGGFTVKIILMDMEFTKIENDMEDVVINTTAAREHVGEIERQIRTVKERARCVISTLPYKYLHHQLIIHLIYFVTFWLNAFPNKHEISRRLSPRELVTGR